MTHENAAAYLFGDIVMYKMYHGVIPNKQALEKLRQNRNKDEDVKIDRGSAARVLRVELMDEYDEQLRKEMIEDQLKGIEDFEWCGTRRLTNYQKYYNISEADVRHIHFMISEHLVSNPGLIYSHSY